MEYYDVAIINMKNKIHETPGYSIFEYLQICKDVLESYDGIEDEETKNIKHVIKYLECEFYHISLSHKPNWYKSWFFDMLIYKFNITNDIDGFTTNNILFIKNLVVFNSYEADETNNNYYFDTIFIDSIKDDYYYDDEDLYSLVKYVIHVDGDNIYDWMIDENNIAIIDSNSELNKRHNIDKIYNICNSEIKYTVGKRLIHNGKVIGLEISPNYGWGDTKLYYNNTKFQINIKNIEDKLFNTIYSLLKNDLYTGFVDSCGNTLSIKKTNKYDLNNVSLFNLTNHKYVMHNMENDLFKIY